MSGKYSLPKTIYLDLDGPLLDFSLRSYNAYKAALALNNGEVPLSKKSYWIKKKNVDSLENIYKSSKGRFHFLEFKKRYLENLENERFLKFDSLQKGALKFLKSNRSKRLVLVTLRKKRSNLWKELKQLKLDGFFVKVLSRNPGTIPHQEKIKLIKSDKLFDSQASWIIGDTEADILAEKALGVKTAAVLSGIRSGGLLKKLKPDIIVKNISRLKLN